MARKVVGTVVGVLVLRLAGAIGFCSSEALSCATSHHARSAQRAACSSSAQSCE